MPEYIGVIHKDASSDLGVSFPTFLVRSLPGSILRMRNAWQPKHSSFTSVECMKTGKRS